MHKLIRWTLVLAATVGLSVVAGAGERPLNYTPMKLDTDFTPPVLAIDSHTHQCIGTADSLAAHMNEWGLQKMVVLQIPGNDIDEMMKEFGRYPDKFAVLMTPDWTNFDTPGWAKDVEHQIRHAKKLGCAGVKLYKDFSVYMKDKEGKLVPVDDPRLEPIWKTAGELHMPILVHVGDPERFWMPPSDVNYIENPDWAFYGSGVPFREELLRELEHVVATHPQTTFVGAHLGNRSEDPLLVGYLMDKYPNYYVDISARYGELCKRPRETRWLLEQYPDRILFGTDWGIWSTDGAYYDSWAKDAQRFYSRAHRILWTRDAKIPTPFDGNEGPILIGTHRWAADGLALPPDVLHKIYVDTPTKIYFPNSK